MENPTSQYRIRRLFLLAVVGWCFASCPAWGCAADPAENEAKEIQRIQQRLEDGSLPEPPSWTLIHMAAAKEKMEALQAISCGNPNEQKPQDLAEMIRKGGGLQKYRQQIAGLLHSRDATVLGFAVVWLANLGDPAYVNDILVLLQSENLPDAGGFGKNWDRGQAVFALGILGGREHANCWPRFCICCRRCSRDREQK